jgi:Phage Mu protein F like protein
MDIPTAMNGERKQAIEAKLTGPPVTLGYRPTIPSHAFWGSDGTPVFNLLWDVEPMLTHPRVESALDYYKSGLADLQIETIEASTPEVAKFAKKEFERFVTRARVQFQHCYDYGWNGYEVCYAVEDDQLVFDFLIDFHPRDTNVLTMDQGYVGIRVKRIDTGYGAVDLEGPLQGPPKAFWATHHRRYNQWHGRSQLYAAWKPWRRLAAPDGAESVVDGGIYRFAYCGPVLYYPPEDYAAQNPSAVPNPVPGRDNARVFVEQAKAGVGVAFPNITDEHGNRKWDLEWPTSTLNVAGLLEYVQYLKREISEGIGTPSELLEASESGSGYSGRAIPMESFLAGQQQNGEEFLKQWQEQIGDPLVHWNYGNDAWFRIKLASILEVKRKKSQGGQQPPGNAPPVPSAPTTPAPGASPPPPGGPSEPANPKMPGMAFAQGVRMSLDAPEQAEAGDLVQPEVEDILQRTAIALNTLSVRGRDELREIFKSGSPTSQLSRVRSLLERYKPLLAAALTDSQIAAALAGMQGVVDRLPSGSLSAESEASATPASPLAPPAIPPVHPPWERPEPPPGEPAPMIEYPIIDEAIASLSRRRLLDRTQYDLLSAAAKQQAFTVAGVEVNDTMQKILTALTEQVREGADFKGFADKIDATVGEGTFLSPAHMETVYRNAVQGAFSEGQAAALDHPLVADAFPYMMYVSIHDDRRRPEHGEMEKLGIQGTAIFRRDDPVVQIFRTPWDYNCRCGWIPLTLEQAASMGIDEAKEWLLTGQPPTSPIHVPMPPFAPPVSWGRVGTAFSFAGVFLAAEWTTFSDPKSGRQGWRSKGGLVRYADPRRQQAAAAAPQTNAQQGSVPKVSEHPEVERAKKAWTAKDHATLKQVTSAVQMAGAQRGGLGVKGLTMIAKHLGITGHAKLNKKGLSDAIVARLATVKPQTPESPPTKPSAQKPTPKVHTAAAVVANIDSVLDKTGLSPEHKKTYKEAIRKVFDNMPSAAVQRFAASTNGFEFYKDTKDLTDEFAAKNKRVAELVKQGGRIAGVYSRYDGILHLDGNATLTDRISESGQVTDPHHTYAHEFSHAIDGPYHEISGSADWQTAWKEEIVDGWKAGKGLSLYGTTKDSEGFAEFGRLVYASETGLDQIENLFPKASAVWKSHGLWPETKEAFSANNKSVTLSGWEDA